VATVLSGTAQFTTKLLQAGTRSLRAYYGGDVSLTASSSPAVPQTVNALPGGGFTAATGSPHDVGSFPASIALADFNGDGIADLAVANSDENTVTVLLSDGSGGFTATAGSPIDVGLGPESIAVGDFNADGKSDLAVANSVGSNVTVLLGNGSGGFTEAGSSPFSVGFFPLSVAVGDFNADGKADLAVANSFDDNVTILLGSGSGGFAAAAGSPVNVGASPQSLAVGDFNADGKADLAVANGNDDNVTVLLGNGSGGFAAASGSPFSVGGFPTSVTVGDFSGDGKADLAVANDTDDNVTILLGNGSGGFTAAAGSPFNVGSAPFSVAVGDFNGDGKADLAGANNFDDNVTVLLGNGSGGFAELVGSPFSVGSAPTFVVVGDFNGDGKADLAVANQFDNNITVLLGATPATVTNVTSSTVNGTYGVGAAISIQVVFTKNVAVTGTPQLALNSGATVNYSSGTGTSTLTFTYTVAAGQNSADLDYTSISALTLNGGTINDLAANAAILTLPAPGAAGSLGANKNIVIGSGPPAPTLVSPLNGAIAVPVSTSLTWSSSTGATSYDVYLSTSNSPSFVANVATTNYTPSPLTASTEYFWKIVAKNGSGSTASAIWSFTTLKPGAQPASVSPSSGSSGRQVFTFVTRNGAGANSIQYAQFLFSKAGISALNACYISYDPSVNVFYLLNDDLTQWYGLQGGSGNTIGNGQCTIHGATSGSSKAGTDLTTNVDISFRSGFAGLKTIYQFAGDTSAGTSGWQSMGTWNDIGDPSVVELVSLSPSSGTGVSQTFTAVTKDGDGGATIPFVQFVMTGQSISAFSGNGCFIHYDRASNVFFLLNDSATAFSGMFAGSGSVSNSQCTLTGAGSGGTVVGSNLTVTYNLTLAAGFTGAKQSYMQAVDNTGVIEVWHKIGTWTR